MNARKMLSGVFALLMFASSLFGATYYVDDTATGAADGSTLADAYTTFQALLTARAPFTAGDVILVRDSHTEGTASTITLDMGGGSDANPVRVFSINGSEAYSAGATIDVSSTADITFGSGVTVWYGMTFDAVDDILHTGSNNSHTFYNCSFDSDSDPFQQTSESTMRLFDCTITCSTSTICNLGISTECYFLMRGGSVTFASANTGEPLVEFLAGSDSSTVIFEDVDFSGCATDMALMADHASSSVNNASVTFRRCQLPTSYTYPSTLSGQNVLLQAENCNPSGSATLTDPYPGINLVVRSGVGSIVSNFTDYRSGGATDGVRNFSWAMTTGANASRYAPLESPPLAIPVAPGAQTVTVYVASDANLNDQQVWMVVEHPDTGTPASPAHVVLANTRGAPLASGSTQPTSTGTTWAGSNTGTDGGTGQQQLVSSSFNPTEAGVVIVRVYVGSASDTVYVDPRPVVQ